MKRYISLLLILTLTVCALAAPVSAAENSIGYIDLMQYGGIYYNDVLYPGFVFTPTEDGRGYIDFPVVLPFKPGNIELLIFTGADITFYTDSSYTNYLVQSDSKISDYYNRYKVVSGSMLGRDQPSDSFRLYFEYAAGDVTPDVSILSAKILPYKYDLVDVPFSFTAYDSWYGSTLVAKGSGVYETQFWFDGTVSSDTDSHIGEITITPDQTYFAGLDYIDISLFIQELEVTSISASVDGVALAVHYTESFIGDGVIGDLTSSDVQDMTMGIYKCVLRVDVSGVSLIASDSDVNIFIGVTGSLMHDGIVSIDGIKAGKYWVEPDPEVTWLTKIVSWLSSISDSMKVYTSQIIATIKGKDTTSSEFHDEVDQELDELDQMQQVMDSVERPDIDSVNVSVDQYVSQADVLTLTSPFTALLTGDVFGPIVIMTILFATVSYVLYGKR